MAPVPNSSEQIRPAGLFAWRCRLIIMRGYTGEGASPGLGVAHRPAAGP
jgi:hypothetical protein